MSEPAFADRLLRWFDKHGRKHLPWQAGPTPYRIWVSEIMLQQTQVETVIPYFDRFMQRFPDIHSLALAEQDEVLSYWSGLGYYARARNLHLAAQVVVNEFDGVFPQTPESIAVLPGIGRSTAAAIASLAFHQRATILDGNVKRVLARHQMITGWPGRSKVTLKLWAQAEALTPHQRCADYTQAIMDLGATLCTRTQPRCEDCPVAEDCKGYQSGEPTKWPTKKPKQANPKRAKTFLILQNPSGEVLLYRRPSPGIWGGLWSLPEFDGEAEVRQQLENVIDAGSHQLNWWPALTHHFTHYELEISPLHIQLKKDLQAGVALAPQPTLWYNTSKQFHGGLPTPIKKLLGKLKLNPHP